MERKIRLDTLASFPFHKKLCNNCTQRVQVTGKVIVGAASSDLESNS